MLTSFFIRAALDIARGAVHRTAPTPPDAPPTCTPAEHLVRDHRTSRDAATVVGECMHVTGVAGGYGASRRHLQWAEQHLARDTEWTTAIMSGEDDEQTLRRIAILGRYCGAFGDAMPYHTIVAPWGQAFYLREMGERTPHGHGANSRFCGFAIDGHWPGRKPVPAPIVAAATAALCRRATLYRHVDAPEVTCHRAHAPLRLRGGDPGPNVWRQVVIPLVRSGIYRASTSTSRGGALPPASWGAA